MSRISRVRLLAIPVAVSAAALIALLGTPTHVQATPQVGVPSGEYWLSHPENDVKAPIDGVYQPNTDADMVKLVQAANAIPRTGKAWKNVGPFGGVKDIASVGSGAEQLGPIEGIGTAIAVDHADATGNTAYFATMGGLYKSTDGGTTLHNLSDANFLRTAVGAIGIDPSNHNNVYAGTGVSLLTLSDDAVGVGTYVSHDAGKTWTRPTQNTHGYGTNVIAVSPTTGWVFVGTNYGLWLSRDHGASFTQIQLPTGATNPLGNWVTSIVVNPANAHEVTVAVGYPRGKAKLPDGTVLGPKNGLYRSMSDGLPGTFNFLASTSSLHWGNNNIGSSSDPVGRVSLAYTDASGTGLWALVSDAGRAAGQQLADLPALPAASPTGGSLLNGLYYSGNDGGTWKLEATAQTLTTSLHTCTTCTVGYPLNYAAGAQAFYNNWVAADPNHPNRVYIGLEETFQGDLLSPALPFPAMRWTAIEKYANACGFVLYPNSVPGQNSVACPSGIPGFGGGSTHPDQHGYAITTTTGGGVRLYSGNDGGWWAQNAHSVTGQTLPSFESGKWTSLNKAATVLPWSINFLDNNDVIMSLQDNGSIHIKPDGTAYNVCGGDGVYVMPGVNKDTYYCVIPGLTTLGTTDDFKHTINVTPGDVPLTGISGASFLSPFQSDRSDRNHIMAAASGVYESTAGVNTNTMDPTNTALLSTSWVNVFTPPTINDAADKAAGLAMDTSAISVTGPVGYAAFCFQCRPSISAGPAINDPSHVHAEIGTNLKPGCVAKKASPDCWHVAANVGLPHEQISGIAVDPNDARTIYVTLRQYLLLGADPKATGTQKVMVSHDAGDHFTDLTGNLPRADAHAVSYRDGQLIVATDVGIFTTTAGSKVWSRLGSGLPAVPYRTMTLNKDGRYLGAGAYGRGAWIYDFGSAAKTPPSVVPKLPGRLSATGLNPAWPITGVALIAIAAFVRRRRRA
jgi:hypothetical protein